MINIVYSILYKMEYCTKVKKLFEVQKLAEKRVNQLQDEENIDKLLLKCYEKCPETVVSYLFNMRALNRKQVYKTHSSSILNYTEHMEKAYNDIEKIQKKFNLLHKSGSEGSESTDICCDILIPHLNNLIPDIINKIDLKLH